MEQKQQYKRTEMGVDTKHNLCANDDIFHMRSSANALLFVC